MAAISSSILPLPETDNVQVYAVDINSHQNMTIWNIPVNFNHTIYTIVTKNPDVIRRWIEGVYAHFGNGLRRFVGMEVEIDIMTGRARTVQFCVGNRCMVIQLEENQPNCPPSLLHFMRDHNQFAFVCSEAGRKMWQLEMALRIQGLSQPAGQGMVLILDLWYYEVPILMKWSILNLSQRAVQHDEGVVDLHWGGPNAYRLSPAQVHYACIDAFLNIHIAKSIWNLN